MYVIVWLCLIVLGLLYKKSKKLAVLQMAFIVLMFTVMEGVADYEEYLSLFHSLNGNIKNVFQGNVLFHMLLYVFGLANSYRIALFLISALAMCILYQSVLFYTDKISFVLSVYLISPFVIDAVQLKNFVAMVIWMYFSRFLYKAFLGESKGRNLLLYLLGVTVSAGFHFSFVILYFFAWIPWLTWKVSIILSVGFGVLGGVLLETNLIDLLIDFIEGLNLDFFLYIVTKFHDYMINRNASFMETRLQITGILYVAIVVMLLVAYFFKRKTFVGQQQKKLDFLIMLNILSAVLFPFMLYSMEIYRVQRNLLLINYAVSSDLIGKKALHDGKLRVSSAVLILFCIVISVYYLTFDCIYWNYESVFAPFFKLQ